MATIKSRHLLEMSDEEAMALEKLLGSMSGDDYTQRGMSDRENVLLSDIYDLLPIYTRLAPKQREG